MMFFILFLSYLKYQSELSSEFLRESTTFIATVNCIILSIKWSFIVMQQYQSNSKFHFIGTLSQINKLCSNFCNRNPAVTTKRQQANGVLHVHSVAAPLVAHCISVLHDVLPEGSRVNYFMRLRTTPKATCHTAH